MKKHVITDLLHGRAYSTIFEFFPSVQIFIFRKKMFLPCMFPPEKSMKLHRYFNIGKGNIVQYSDETVTKQNFHQVFKSKKISMQRRLYLGSRERKRLLRKRFSSSPTLPVRKYSRKKSISKIIFYREITRQPKNHQLWTRLGHLS